MPAPPSTRPWWLRWDGMPPSVERRIARSARTRVPATGWRRWFDGGTIWGPGLLGIAQVLALTTIDDQARWLVALRGFLLALCVLQLVATWSIRRSRRRAADGA